MYDRTIPAFDRGLAAISGILAKAEAHCVARKIEPSVLLTDRLFPDMLPFTRQVQIATDHARRCPARLAGVEPLSMADTETSFAELQDRIARTREHLKGFDRAALDAGAARQISFKAGNRELSFSGSDYVGLFALPNFYFHLSIAHAILRHDGVEIGKADFIGA